jgi:FkbM family methyltransferase
MGIAPADEQMSRESLASEPDSEHELPLEANVDLKRVARFPLRMGTYGLRRVLRPTIIRHRGVRLAIDGGVLSPNMVAAFYKGIYESPEADLIRATMTPDDRVLELGGGVGFIGIIAARIVRHPDQVLIVEANPQLIPVMEQNFDLNGVRPAVRNSVLGKSDAKDVSFFVHQDFWASSLTKFPGARETKVPQLDVRIILSEFRPTYMILDIEGGEIDLFNGLNLDGIQKLCLEVHPQQTGQGAVDNLFASFHAQGFVLEHASRLKNVVFFRRRSSHSPDARPIRSSDEPAVRAAR